MQRRRREIDIFNISMLDVLCSALGAILILFLVTLQNQARSQAAAEDWEQKYEQLERKIQEQQQTIAQLEEEKKRRRRAVPTGEAIGMCEVSRSSVRIAVFDHKSPDGDLIRIKINESVVASEVTLAGEDSPANYDIPLEPGVNYIIAEALNQGSQGPNTAKMTVTPCSDGQPMSFTWEMKTDESRHISVVRR